MEDKEAFLDCLSIMMLQYARDMKINDIEK